VIDERTRDAFEIVRKKALHEGIDLLEAMDRAGLVMTEQAIKHQWANCLEQLWLNIESQPIVALVQLGGGQNTPLDATKGILQYIDFFQKEYLRQSGRRT
jgi:hypothetical protein